MLRRHLAQRQRDGIIDGHGQLYGRLRVALGYNASHDGVRILISTAMLPPARQGKITYASYFTNAFISRPNVSILAEPSANTIGSSLPHIALALFNLSELESGHAEVAL